MTSQGSAHGRFQRAIQRRHVQAAEMAAKVLLLSSGPMIRLFEEVGSGTMTVRVRADRDFALLVWSARPRSRRSRG
jgi:hypothetical protein